MANAQKYTRAACGHLAAHYERRKDEKGEYVKFGNQDIDPQKTHLNYNLCPRRGLEQIDFIRQRTTEARTLKRDDVNVMCSWVVTLPEYRHHNQNLHVSPDKEQVERLFFERTYQFLCDRYGEQNVISAYVHKDEKTPHMHFAFVPVAVKRTAVAVESMTAERDQALARAERADLRATAAEAKVKTAYEDANRQLQAKIREVEQDRPSMKAQMEIVQLRKENQTLKTENNTLRSKVSDLEAMVRRLGQIIREKLPEVYAAITQPKRDRQQPPQKQKPKSRDLER